MVDRSIIFSLVAFSLFVSPRAVRAESSGRTGRTSNGSAEISLEIPQSLKTADLPPLVFPVHRAGRIGGDLAATQIIVFSNDDQESGAFSILGTGSGGAFELRDASKKAVSAVPFEVHIDQIGKTRQDARLEVVPPLLLRSSPDGGETVHTLSVKLPNGHDRAFLSGTLTLLIRPE
jgi:hypothetical protein